MFNILCFKNMNFKELYNQKNKKELLKNLDKEDFQRTTISFYKYTKLNKLEELRDILYLKAVYLDQYIFP